MTLLGDTLWRSDDLVPAAPVPFVRTSVHGAALDALRPSLDGMPGLALVSGATGTGKTALALALAAELAADAGTAVGIADVATTRGDLRLLRAIVVALSGAPSGALGRSGLQLLTELRAHVARLARAGQHSVLLLDNAQALTGSQLEIVRSLLGPAPSSTASAVGPTIVLFATPELRDRIARRSGLAGHLVRSVALCPLDRADMALLLQGRTTLGAAGRPPLSAAAINAIAAVANGIPARALPLAEAAQAEAIARGWEQVDERIVAAVLATDLGNDADAAHRADGDPRAATQAPLPLADDGPSPRLSHRPQAQLTLLGGEEGEA